MNSRARAPAPRPRPGQGGARTHTGPGRATRGEGRPPGPGRAREGRRVPRRPQPGRAGDGGPAQRWSGCQSVKGRPTNAWSGHRGGQSRPAGAQGATTAKRGPEAKTSLKQRVREGGQGPEPCKYGAPTPKYSTRVGPGRAGARTGDQEPRNTGRIFRTSLLQCGAGPPPCPGEPVPR